MMVRSVSPLESLEQISSASSGVYAEGLPMTFEAGIMLGRGVEFSSEFSSKIFFDLS